MINLPSHLFIQMKIVMAGSGWLPLLVKQVMAHSLSTPIILKVLFSVLILTIQVHLEVLIHLIHTTCLLSLKIRANLISALQIFQILVTWIMISKSWMEQLVSHLIVHLLHIQLTQNLFQFLKKIQTEKIFITTELQSFLLNHFLV